MLGTGAGIGMGCQGHLAMELMGYGRYGHSAFTRLSTGSNGYCNHGHYYLNTDRRAGQVDIESHLGRGIYWADRHINKEWNDRFCSAARLIQVSFITLVCLLGV